jgi:hypothetical protein
MNHGRAGARQGSSVAPDPADKHAAILTPLDGVLAP